MFLHFEVVAHGEKSFLSFTRQGLRVPASSALIIGKKAAKGKAVPSAIIPSAITKFVAENFSGQEIVEISRKRGGYEVELSNGTELKLTEDAKPFTENRSGQRGNRPRR